MDIKEGLDYRYKISDAFIEAQTYKYNYSKNGILTKCLPKILFKGNNTLVTFLQLIDLRCIMLFKYIDKLKNFKHITKYI